MYKKSWNRCLSGIFDAKISLHVEALMRRVERRFAVGISHWFDLGFFLISSAIQKPALFSVVGW